MDYAATPIQPIAHALVLIVGDDDAAFLIDADGISGVDYNGIGDYTFTLDKGVPGTVSLPSDLGTPEDAARISLTIRGSGGLAPGQSHVATKAVNWLAPANPNAGITQFRLVLLDTTGAPVDPLGIEIVVWRGNVGNPLAKQTLIGPLYQPVITFP